MQNKTTNNYLKWNDIIAKHFFRKEMAGKEVLLYVNEPLITKLGSPYGTGLAGFIDVVKEGPDWAVSPVFCQKALQAFQDWRSRNLEYPPYIAYLAFFVLAAGVEGDFAVQAYYPRLRKLLGEHGESGTPRSFDRMIDLWDDLEKWSREDKHESMGRFVARIRGGWWKVGLPLSQTLISEDERKHLPILFNEADLDPTDVPSANVIFRVLREYGSRILERRTYNLLDSRSKDDNVLKEALVDFVLDELEQWDGTEIEEYAAEEGRQTRQTHTGLRICLTLDSFAHAVQCHIRFKTSKSFPEEGLNFTQAGKPDIWSCTEIHQGWSKVLRDRQTEVPVTLDGASLDWVNGESLVDNENRWQAKLRGATTRLFLPGQPEGLPGWIEKQRLERNVKFLIASYGEDILKVRRWGNSGCIEFEEFTVSGLPKGWVLFSGRNARKSCSDIDVLAISSTIRLLIRGGIKTGTGNAYLKFAPPYIVVENAQGHEIVKLNGVKVERAGPDIPVWYLPGDALADVPLRIDVQVGEQTFRRVLRLEAPELPFRSYYNHCRNTSGDLCQKESIQQQALGGTVSVPADSSIPPYTGRLPLHLSKRIIFVGENPGEICDWPHEFLPAWQPVWALAKISRKKARVFFCGTPEQALLEYSPGQPLADRSLLRRWKDVIWHRRRLLIQPEIIQLREKWKKYMMAAKDV